MNGVLKEEREIDLRDLLYFVCKRWRSILVGTAVAAIFLPAVRIPALLKLSGAGAILKSGAKYVILGAVIGAFLMCFVYGMKYICSGKVKSVAEFKNNCSLNLLGVIPKENGRKGKPDKAVMRMGGIRVSADDTDALVERMAEEIRTIVKVKAGKEKVSIAVVSSVSEECADRLAEALKKRLSDVADVRMAGDVLAKAESIQAAVAADYVVLSEAQDETAYETLSDVCDKLALWEKEVPGVVLWDADGR